MSYEYFKEWAPWIMEKLILDFSLSVDDAAAIVGNAGHESGGFKQLQELKPLVPGSKGGYGIMQWTGPRRREYESYCKRNRFDPSDMMTNYKFLFVELKGPEGKVLPKLKAAKSLDEKVEIFMKVFLRPGIPHLDQRKIWARRALSAYEKRSDVKIVDTTPEIKDHVDEAPRVEETLFDLIIKIFRAILRRK